MSRFNTSSKTVHVSSAIAVIAVLAGLLGFRLFALKTRPVERRAGRLPAAGSALVPRPQPVSLQDLEVPCWGCREAKQWSLRFKTNLDYLAPLGTGDRNAAIWFKDFAKQVGSRSEDADRANKRKLDYPGRIKNRLPPDDPVLLESEPWCEQAVMRFFPDYFELDGYRTRVPNLLFMLTLAKSYIARGLDAEDPERAMEDIRRAIRLGRLLRQEDTVVINDLVGLECIHLGAQAMYTLAQRQGDEKLALVSAIVIGEVAPQRMLTFERITGAELEQSHLRRQPSGAWMLEVPEDKLKEIVEKAMSDPDRRFRCEALMSLHILYRLGSAGNRAEAARVLDLVAEDPDPILADTVRWCKDTPLDSKALQEIFPQWFEE